MIGIAQDPPEPPVAAKAPPPVSQEAMTVAGVKVAGPAGNTTRHDTGKVVTELMSVKLVGESDAFERGPHVPVTHRGYFKPSTDPFFSNLKPQDRLSSKEQEYANAAGIWMDLGPAALGMDEEQDGDAANLYRLLSLAKSSFKAVLSF